MSSGRTAGHVREHGSLLAPIEKRALIWMAKRLPPSVNSDHLTILGLAAMACAGGAFWASHWFDASLFIVVGALAVNWFGDSLDGTVARVRNQQRPMYGFYVDHVIDIIGAVFLLGGLSLSPYMSPIVALVLLVAYLTLSAEIYLATHARGIFPPCSRLGRPNCVSSWHSARSTCSTNPGSNWVVIRTASSTSAGSSRRSACSSLSSGPPGATR